MKNIKVYDWMIAYFIILILLIYSVIVTYLYWRERKKGRKGDKFSERDVDIKIQEIGDRLEEIKRDSERTRIDLDEEDW